MRALPLCKLMTSSVLGTALLAVTSAAKAQTNPITAGTITVKLQRAATVNVGTDGTPQDLALEPGDASRVFIATRNGKIEILSGGAISPTPFLSLSAAGIPLYTGGEGGLLGLAFSPNFNAASNVAGSGKFYTFGAETYSAANTPDFSSPELAPTTATPPNNQIVIREWSVNPATPNVANASSRVLMRINHPDTNHQGGSLRFGLDGDLYIGLGDGGGANDTANGSNPNLPSDGHTSPSGNGQDTSVVFGKILRIDPRGSNSANGQYGIPANNPFASGGGLSEIYAYGLRNPFRTSFDSATGKFYAGDVGQGQREEVDNIVNGGNYGWAYREGSQPNTLAGRPIPSGFTSIDPIGEYTHGDGIAVIGGYVYHGSLIPALDGQYVFGDLGGAAGSVGRLFYMDPAGGTIHSLNLDLAGVQLGSNLYGFGEGSNGELYAFFSNGDILAVTPEPGVVALFGLTAALMLLQRRRMSPELARATSFG